MGVDLNEVSGNFRWTDSTWSEHSETSPVSIYIAWDDDALGPYTPAQVAQLVECGCLSLDDYAAREGDAAWVPLSSLLTVEAAPQRAGAGPLAPPTRRSWRAWFVAALLVLTVLAVFTVPMFMRTRGDSRRRVSAAPVIRPLFRATLPGTREMPEISASDLPPAEEQGGRLSGTISLAATDTPAVPAHTLTVRAYPLKGLEPYLAQKKAAAQVELARLAPLLEGAESEKKIRVAAEQSARQDLLDTSPTSELYPAMRFAHQHAVGAVRVAEDNFRRYRSQRHAVTDGKFYLYDLPAAVATAETNTQGEFTMQLPSGGPFAVVAADFQNTETVVRARYWMVKISFSDASEKTLSLSDQNATSVASAESLIQTED